MTLEKQFGKVFLSARQGVIEFFLGFIIGTIFDIIFSRIYKKLDPDENNNVLLFFILIVQLYIIFVILFGFEFIINKIKYDNFAGTYPFRFGLLSSQVFMMETAVNTLTNIIFGKDRQKKNKVE